MPDDWETDHFGAADRDGSGDFDGDGISDLDEYLNGFDPTTPDSAPGTPEIVFPLDGEQVDQLAPVLEILDSFDPQGDAVTYTFEVYADASFEHLIASRDDVPSQAETSTWQVPAPLEDNTLYFCRWHPAP